MKLNIKKIINLLFIPGTIGVMPTDTVYGIVARAYDEKAINRLYSLKKRINKPGTLIAADIQQLRELGIDSNILDQAKNYWPGPVSIILPFSNKNYTLTNGKEDIAARIPANEQIKEILATVGPLLTTSANPPHLKPATNLKQAKLYFNDKVDFYIDGGDRSLVSPSTILSLYDNKTTKIR